MKKLLKKYETRLGNMLKNNTWLTQPKEYNLLVDIVNDLRKEVAK